MSGFQPTEGSHRQKRIRRSRATEQLFSARPKDAESFVPYADEDFGGVQVVPYAPNGATKAADDEAPAVAVDTRDGYRSNGQAIHEGYSANSEEGRTDGGEYASNHEKYAPQFEGYTPNHTGAKPNDNADGRERYPGYAPNEPSKERDVSLSPEPEIFSPKPIPAESGETATPNSGSLPDRGQWNPYAKPSREHQESTQEEAGEVFSASAYYRRPAGEPDQDQEGSLEGFKFVPPPKFSVPGMKPFEDGWEENEPKAYAPAHYYQPKAAEAMNTERRESLTIRHDAYRVEAETEAGDIPRKRAKGRGGKGLLIGVCIFLLLGIGAFLCRDWIGQQITVLFGESSQPVGGQTQSAQEQAQVRGYDPAPAVKLNEKAAKGIAAISGTLEMETYAVTASHVVARVQTGEESYDFYLFSATNGQLLGYYENLPQDGLRPQADDLFYVQQAPWLINKEGKAALTTSAYAQHPGESLMIHAFENGWAIIRDEGGTQLNYMNREGELLSTLWFARTVPFYGDYTIAYVDTGNLAMPETRYILYVLSADGEMERWEASADMQGVSGAASGMALTKDGALVALSDITQPICQADEVIAYVDCDALVVLDSETGKYGLFVKGEQYYDFAYDSIAPIPCDIQWESVKNGDFTLCAVAGAAYPQPLSHYFALRKGETEEIVALSTRSIYPVILK